MTLVLASASPRRYQILSLLKMPFLMVPPDAPEKFSENRSPSEEVLYQSHRKVASLVAQFPGSVLLGSDTLIHADGHKIGKPKDRDDARNVLRRLQGRTHEVVTGVAILNEADGRSFEWVETVRITMHAVTEGERDAYVATGEPLDKAGGYALQGEGRRLIERLEGDYLAAVGLPLKAVVAGLGMVGVPVDGDVERIYEAREFLNWRTFA